MKRKKKKHIKPLFDMSPTKLEEKKIAYHEAGHFVMALQKGIHLCYATMGNWETRHPPHVKEKFPAHYIRRFSKVEGIIPQLMDTDKIKAAYHLYLLQIDPEIVGGDIQLFKKKLTEKRVVQIQHFAPLYKFTAIKQFGYDIKAIEKTCPVTEELFNHRFTHLPLYDFNDEQLKYMADSVIECVEEMKNGK